MSAVRGRAPGRQPDIRELEDFVYHEARLLDEQRWEEWNALFVEDGEYWVPAAPSQPNPRDHVSLIYETGLLRAVRIKRYRHPHALSLQPKPRSVHLVSNVTLDSHDAASGDCVVKSRFIMLQYRREKQDVFGGSYTHHLKSTPEGLRIAMKRVDLVNCDAALENILIYL
ncbi:MAG: aromatic-ring-hydroxylating dioxygenase subunit beta [Gammaproteobacteria bacterium]|nr:aromatic-ring-hydroxylating dioxygenase subunit beta [Gammaproteobacteria bacterium]